MPLWPNLLNIQHSNESHPASFEALLAFRNQRTWKRDRLRRLFSTFASGLPGVGLLLMRVVSTSALLIRGITALHTELPLGSAILEMLGMTAGVLLFLGLWTPFSGALVAVFG